MDISETLDELYNSIPIIKAHTLNEILAFIQPDKNPYAFEKAILSDKRFIHLRSDFSDEDHFFLDLGLFKWLMLLNIRLAQKKIFRLSVSQVASKFSSLRTSGKWNMPPFEAIKWGEALGLICTSYVKDEYVFPLACLLSIMKKGLFIIAADVVNDLYENKIWNCSLKKKTNEYLYEGLSSFSKKTSYIIRSREALMRGDRKTLQEIGNNFNLTRERIRQIENKFWSSLRYRLRSLKPFVKAFLCDFMSESGGLLIDIDSSRASRRMFLSKCLRIPTLALPYIGIVVLAISQKKLLHLKSSKWFPRDLNSDTIAKRLDSEGKICLSGNDVQKLSKSMIEFRLRGLSKFQRTYLALREIGRPAHFYEITHVHNTLWPNHSTAEHNIHVALSYQKMGIVWIGLKGTYALKEWGYDRPSMTLFETIAEIVQKKFYETLKPVSIEIITAELGKYRKIVKHSSITIATHINPRIKQIGKNKFVPKHQGETTKEEINLDELDRIFKDFQKKKDL